MIDMRNCLNCQKEYLPFSRIQKYCSKKCADRYYQLTHPRERMQAWRKYNETHRIEQKRRSKEWYIKNREKVLAYNKEFRSENAARTRAKTLARKYMEKICTDCGSTENVHLHHKDFNPFNNDLTNFIYLCSPCHGKRHQKVIE